MIESQYTTALHKKLAPHIYKWKVNDNFAGGVPDAFYRTTRETNARPLWVEYKFLKKLPARGDTRIVPNLSAQQLIWLEQAVSSGEQALVIVGIESERIKRQTAGFIMTSGEWREGVTCQEANIRLKSMSNLASEIEALCA
jgi:hypothetical protein